MIYKKGIPKFGRHVSYTSLSSIITIDYEKFEICVLNWGTSNLVRIHPIYTLKRLFKEVSQCIST